MKKEIIVIATIIIIIFLFLMLQEPSEPKELVSEKTVLNYSNILFSYQIIKYPTSIEIVPTPEGNMNVGLNGDPWDVKFGTLPGNGSFETRYVNVKNLYGEYSKIELKAYGNISSLLNFSKNDFALDKNDTAAIGINLYSDSAEYGNYSGEIDIIIKKPRFDFLRVIM